MSFRLRPSRIRRLPSGQSELNADESLPLDVENASLKGLHSSDDHVSLARIYLLSIASFGIQAAWALEMAVITPYFASALGSGPIISHVIWVMGPMSGLIVAPLVGRLSDNCTSRLGRRRPFIIAGAVGTFCGMIVLSSAREIAAVLYPSGKHSAALVIAVASFAVLDLAINTSQLPGTCAMSTALFLLPFIHSARVVDTDEEAVRPVHVSTVRALQADLVPHRQQHTVQSATVVMGSLGDFFVNLVLMRYEDPILHLRFLFLLTAMLYVGTSFVMMFVVSEEQHKVTVPNFDERPTKREGLSSRLMKIPMELLTYWRSIPGWLWRIGGAFALGFFAFFCVRPNASAWLGSSVLQGDPDGSPAAKKRYELGMTVVGRAGTVRALLSVVTAAAYPRMVKLVSPDKLIGTSFLLYGVIAILFAGTHNVFLGQVSVAAYAIPCTLLTTIPHALTMQKSTKANRGKHLGSLCIFAVIPQLIDTAYTGWVSKTWGEAWVMRIGGLWSLLGAVFAFSVLRPDSGLAE